MESSHQLALSFALIQTPRSREYLNFALNTRKLRYEGTKHNYTSQILKYTKAEELSKRNL